MHIPERLRKALPFALIVLLGLLSYANTFPAPFVFDDLQNVLGGDALGRGLPSIHNFEAYWWGSDRAGAELTGKQLFKTRFISFGSLLLNYRLGGLDVRGYHAVNLGLHLLNACLVYLLVLVTLQGPVFADSAAGRRAPPLALFAAAAFVSHPMMTEGVTYISQRSGLLASLFYLSAILFYARYRLLGGKVSYLACLVSAACAMFSKEDAFTIPLAALLYEAVFIPEGTVRERLKRLAPLFVISLIIPAVYITENLGQGGVLEAVGSSTRYLSGLPRDKYLMTQFVVVAKYLGLLLVPVGQNLDHDVAVVEALLSPPAFLSFLLLAGLVASAMALKRWWERYPTLRLVSFGIAWFFLTLSVTSSIMPARELMVEYRVYLPALGFYLSLAGLAALAMEGGSGLWLRRALLALCAALPLALCLLSYGRNAVWQSPLTLWDDVVAKSPHKARGYFNRALAYNDLGEPDKAMADYDRALELLQGMEGVYGKQALAFTAKSLYFNRANIHARRGDYDRAIEDYTSALDLDPGYAEAFCDRGHAYFRLGLPDLALMDYNRALALRPAYDIALNNRGVLFASQGRLAEAVRDFEAALTANPAFKPAANNRDYVLGLMQGR